MNEARNRKKTETRNIENESDTPKKCVTIVTREIRKCKNVSVKTASNQIETTVQQMARSQKFSCEGRPGKS